MARGDGPKQSYVAAEQKKAQTAATQKQIDDAVAAAVAQQQNAPSNFEQDIATGEAFGKRVLGEGLGRLSTDPRLQQLQKEAQRLMGAQQQEAAVSSRDLQARFSEIQKFQENPELAAIQQRLQSVADQGLSRQELQAQREKAYEEIGRTTQTASRRAQALLARSGVQGATAGRQLLDIELQGARTKSGIERDLFLESEKIRREGLGNLASFGLQRENLANQRQFTQAELGLRREQAQEASTLARKELQFSKEKDVRSNLEKLIGLETGIKTFDLGQAAREKDIILQAGLGFSQIGSSERSASKQAEAISQQQPVSSCFLAGQRVKMADGSLKPIEEIKPGEVVAHGGVVRIIGQGLESEKIYIKQGLRITGEHAIFDGKGWTRAQNVLPHFKIAKPLPVYNLVCDNHKMEVEGILVGDFYDPRHIDGLRGLVYNWRKTLEHKLKSLFRK